MGTTIPDEGGKDVDEIIRNRVMLVDNHPVWIEALSEDLTEEGSEIVAVAKDEAECLQWARATRPNVVVMDLQVPAPDGAACTELLVRELPDIQILVMSTGGEREDVLRVIKSGTRGYLVKSVSKAELIKGVRRTAAGDAMFTPGLTGLVLGEFQRMVNVAHSHDGDSPVLTARGVKVLRQVTKDLAYQEIAEKLFVSHRIVQNHMQNVLHKLRLHNRVELTLCAIDQGLHDPNE